MILYKDSVLISHRTQFVFITKINRKLRCWR